VLTTSTLSPRIYGSRYEFPKNLKTRKLTGYILIPVLFYSPLLIGLATNDSDEGVSNDFLMAIAMFLSIFVGLFMFVVYSQRPWVIIEDYTMTVEKEEFQIKHLAAMSLFMKGRAGLEPTQFIITFNVVEPGISVRRYETHPIRSIKDADALVRDLQKILPDVPYYDRTPLAEAIAAHDRIDAAQKETEG
jgi:hypothetical protein